jgi:phenylacetate-CoA ligase
MRIGRLDPIFKGLDNSIKETQIVQEDLEHITIKIVTDIGYQNDNAARLVSELRKRVGECMKFKIEYVDSIPKTRAGKFQAVISNVDPT